MPSLTSVSFRALVAGSLAGLVGFTGSFVIVAHGLQAAGASAAEVISGIMALSILMGGGGIFLSTKTRMPISVAWSTPGAVLLTTTGFIEGGYPAAVGGFVMSSLLLVLAGAFKPLGRAVSLIPSPLANAMLAGILLHLCLAPAHAMAEHPLMGVLIIGVWAVVYRLKRVLAIPAALVTVLVAIGLSGRLDHLFLPDLLGHPVWIMPSFSFAALLGISLPLFIVTMSSQNIPGMAVLASNGFKPEAGPLFAGTGLLSLLSNGFGGHAVNLAAITAAMCAGPDADPDPAKRYWAGIASGIVYVVFGIFAGGAMALIGIVPPLFIEAVAGLALIGAFSGAIVSALSDAAYREASALTFLVTASGTAFFGIGSAFWGLLAGGVMLALRRIGPSA
jgi:benzoate membrane transport protein